MNKTEKKISKTFTKLGTVFILSQETEADCHMPIACLLISWK